jgi:hypothetical protein
LDASHAKGVLEGILSLVCRELKIDPKPYRIKPGGAMLSESLVYWYLTVQSPATAKEVSRNSKRAKRLGLIKTDFIISRETPDAPILLGVHEWDAARDWKQGPTILLELSPDDMKARNLMAEVLKRAIVRSLKR